MKHRMYYSAFSLLLVFGATSLAHAGLIVKEVVKNANTRKISHTTTYIDGNRMAVRGDNGSGMIFDGDKMVSSNYDIHHGYYMEMTMAEMKTMMVKSKAMANKMMQEELKHMSPKMRRQVMAEMKKQTKGPTYKRLGSARKVGNWRCVPVAQYSSSGEQEDSMCIATYKELGLANADRKVFKAMSKFMAASSSGGDGSSGLLSETAQKQLGIKGLPVVEQDNTRQTRIVSIRHGDVPASVFRLPKGLKKRSLGGMFGTGAK